MCNKTSVIKVFKKIVLGKRMETWIADSYLGQGVRFLPGSRWGLSGGQGLEVVLKLILTPLQKQ